MNRRTRRWIGRTTAATVAVLFALATPGDEPTRVTRPHGGRELCSRCHDDLALALEGSVTHAPVAADDCTQCHNPHAARHGMLLHEQGDGLCSDCHESVAAGPDQLPHLALNDERACMTCHAPHASDHSGLLVKDSAALCAECHDTLAAQLESTHVHAPVELGMCEACHAPHASERGGLLVADAPELCTDCHELSAALSGRHGGFELAGVDCAGCHNPHAGAEAGLLRPLAHAPFESGECDTCHASTSDPAELVADTTELCGACHDGHEHQTGMRHPIGAEVGCTDCHSPHVGESPGMLRGEEARVCLDCHTELERHLLTATSRHPNRLEQGRCLACHAVHEPADAGLLRAERSSFCQGCHEDHSRFAHPMGSNVVDPRDPTRVVECLSCHDPHASDEPMTLLAEPGRELCVQCHGELHGAN